MADPEAVIADPSLSGYAAVSLPTAKEKKYDRQLRLWGSSGQEALENAHIALMNVSAVGTETLKNLVLPGIGHFTVIDSGLVEEADLGVNFFVTADSIGRSRAEVVSELLGELNPDSKGAFINAAPAELLGSAPETFSKFTHFLVSSPVTTQFLFNLQSQYANTPLFFLYSLGFVSSFRISVPELTIVETHPESTVDLRLLNPWPELSQLMEDRTQGLDAMAEKEHGHIPYVLLLLYYLKEWKTQHGTYPSNYKEKSAFKDIVRDGMRTDVAGGSEENFDEAYAAVMNHVKKTEISSSLKEIFKDEKCEQLTVESSDFWIIARAIRDFYNEHSELPLSGTLPDMKAESKDYITLQKTYRRKAQEDLDKVESLVQRHLTSVGRDASAISRSTVEIFTKHTNYAKLIRYRTLEQENKVDETHANAIKRFLSFDEGMNESLIYIAIALKGYQKFVDDRIASSAATIHPGETDENIEADTETVLKNVKHYLSLVAQKTGETADPGAEEVVPALVVDWVKEIVRSGGGEFHNISSMMGGIAAQEIIKIITHQYIPSNNTILIDAIKSKTGVFEL